MPARVRIIRFPHAAFRLITRDSSYAASSMDGRLDGSLVDRCMNVLVKIWPVSSYSGAVGICNIRAMSSLTTREADGI